MSITTKMKFASLAFIIFISFTGFAQNVKVLGSLGIEDGTQGYGKFLVSDSSGLASWVELILPITNVQVDNESRDITGTWTLGPIFDQIIGFRAGSRVKVTYHIPSRNNTTSYGGLYIEPQISFDNGLAWHSLGSCGYDGGVMVNGAAVIGFYNNSLLIDPSLEIDYSVKVRFYYKAYEGTATINGGHDINNISNTATLMAGNNGLQHYTTVIIEEIF